MIDVVIPVHRPDERFYALIRGLVQQSCQPSRIIIMYTLSGDNDDYHALENRCSDIAKGVGANTVTEVHPIAQNDFYHGRTRNRGIAYGRNPYILCMTQDAVPENRNLIRNMMDVLEMNPDVSQVYCRQNTDENAPEYIRLTQKFNYPEKIIYKGKEDFDTMGIKTIFCSNVCCMYRRDVFEFLGGFEDRVIFNEDMIFAGKAVRNGYKICYYGMNGVIHYHKYKMRAQFRRNFDLAVSQKMNSEAFEGLSSTTEGIKMVKTIIKTLMGKKCYGQVITYFFLSSAKYLGYTFGKHYEAIPLSLRRRMSGSPSFWD